MIQFDKQEKSGILPTLNSAVRIPRLKWFAVFFWISITRHSGSSKFSTYDFIPILKFIVCARNFELCFISSKSMPFNEVKNAKIEGYALNNLKVFKKKCYMTSLFSVDNVKSYIWRRCYSVDSVVSCKSYAHTRVIIVWRERVTSLNPKNLTWQFWLSFCPLFFNILAGLSRR